MKRERRPQAEINREKIDRSIAVSEMMRHPGWKFIEKELQSRIHDNKNIMRISEENVQASFIRQKNKVEIYSGILDTLNEWVKEGETLLAEQEAKDGRR